MFDLFFHYSNSSQNFISINFPYSSHLKTGEPDEAIDGPDDGYDIVVDDDTVGSELVNNQYGHESPQIHQVQHIAHVQNLQQFSPAYPVQPLYRPHVSNIGSGVYFKQNEPEIKSVDNKLSEDKIERAETTTYESKIETTEPTKIDSKTEKTEKTAFTTVEYKTDKIEVKKLPTPMNEVLAVDVTTVQNN